MIIDTLNQKIADAMKVHDEVRVSTFKLLLTELHNYQIDHPNMTSDEEINVVKKEAKKRKDAIEAYEKAGLTDRVKRENAELTILKEFLPEELDLTDLEKFVDEAIKEVKATSIKEMGKVIGIVMQKTKGSADGAKTAELVRSKLSA